MRSAQRRTFYIIFLSFLLSLLLFFLIDHVVYERLVVGPLRAELSALPGIDSVTVSGRGDSLRVIVTPEDDAPLAALYADVLETTTARLGAGAEKSIELLDTRTPLLEEVYEQLRFAIEEAVATGRFTRLTASVGEVSQAFGLDRHAIYIDAERIYLELETDRHRLLAVIPRHRGPTDPARS